MSRLAIIGGLALAVVSCKAAQPQAPPVPEPAVVSVAPPAPLLHRLSIAQYTLSVHDLFGADIVVASSLEPDVSVEGLVSVGMSQATISPTGVERYEKSALTIAQQVVAKPNFSSCTLSSASDTACYGAYARTTGQRVWRRPLTDAEVTELATVASGAATAQGDVGKGFEAIIATLLQAPDFLFRVELGEPDPDHAGKQRFSSIEMASRLSYFLTGSTPDDTLLAAGITGALVTDTGLKIQATRLLSSPVARTAMKNFFTELYGLTELDSLSKDPKVFQFLSADLGASAKTETLMDLEKLIFDDNGDFRTFFTSYKTFLNPRLGALYDVRVNSLDGFAEVQLPADGPRRGFFGQASFLALQAHPTSTSAVLRGKFVRNKLLCQTIPPPPVGVNTGLPPPSTTVHTMRDKVAQHLKQGTICAGCHSQMDPIGLGFENFDGLGSFRQKEDGVTIDASGDLDGNTFAGPAKLAEVVVNDARFGPCFARNMYRYATGHLEADGETEQVSALGQYFVADGFKVKDLMLATAMSAGFRQTAQVTP